MASNVFGTCITNEYLSKMEKYQGQTTFTRQDRAKVAIETRYSEGKDEAARNFVTRLRDMFVIEKKAEESQVSTMCLYYNATGNAVRLYDQQSYDGRIWEFPVPSIIGNGQWGAFLCSGYGCKTVLSNAGKNIQGQDVHWTTAFSVGRYLGNAVAADIQLIPSDARRANNESNYANVVQRLTDQRKSASLENNNGASLFASLGATATTILETIMTLPGVLDD